VGILVQKRNTKIDQIDILCFSRTSAVLLPSGFFGQLENHSFPFGLLMYKHLSRAFISHTLFHNRINCKKLSINLKVFSVKSYKLLKGYLI